MLKKGEYYIKLLNTSNNCVFHQNWDWFYTEIIHFFFYSDYSSVLGWTSMPVREYLFGIKELIILCF